MRVTLLAGMVFGLSAGQALPQSIDANILTGGASGTYIQIGRDISAVLPADGVDLIVNESNGSLENIYGVYKRPQTQLGIVQNDVLDFIRNLKASDAELNSLAAKVRLVMPLYNEEIHLVARPGLAGLSDLSQARVSVGPQDSGSQLTASLLLDATGVTPRKTVSLSTTEALEAFLAGDIDAFFYVGGAPLKLLADPRLTPENSQLLPLDDPRLADYYVSSTIPAGTYAFQPTDYNGLAVKAVLMTYDFSSNPSSYFKQSCAIVTDVTRAVWENIDALKQSGHPKWQAVDLQDVPPGWEKDECVRRGEQLATGGDTVFSDPSQCGEIVNPITRQLCLSQTAK
ncbi:TAXI family TRAP transporter solute-binding subunit [Palleronia caenipelagi]|nr:TAXI family TRAP transporter solute-binding subunit [Palleronia caenipelagi]